MTADRRPLPFCLLVSVALAELACPAFSAEGLGEEAIDPAGRWVKIFEKPKDDVGPRHFCKPVPLPRDLLFIWGPPGKTAASDWCAGAFEPKGRAWKPLVPVGKEAWLRQRPEMRYQARWGHQLHVAEVEGTLQPVPMCHFNQAAYVPTRNKILYYTGGRTLTFDPATNTWAELKPKTSPPLVLWGALEYDPVNDEVLLFGGGAMCAENRPGTWLFSPKTHAWRKLDQPLAEQPPARCNAPLAYDWKNKLIAVFGGDAHDRYLSDTWVYDCTERRWRELRTNVRPYPRGQPAFCYLQKHGVFMMGGEVPGVPQRPGFSHKSPGAFGEETWILDAATGTWTRVAGKFPAALWTSAVYDANRDCVLLCRASGHWPQQTEIYSWKPSMTPAGAGGLAPEKPVYKYHPPDWYEEDLPPADPTAGAKLISELTPNQWTKVQPPKPAIMRTWGSATVDTDRHDVLYWGGGHCGYCGTDVSHFSLATLRWCTGFPPELPPAPYNGFYGHESSFVIGCRSFSGRPWVQHGRVSYAYDPGGRKVLFTQSISSVPTRGWTYVYDPEKKDFVDVFEQPFVGGYAVSGLTVSTPRGVFEYLSPGDHPTKYVGLFRLDLKARKWINLTQGKATVPSNEYSRLVYDSRRDRLVLLSRESEPRDSPPAMYAWELSGAVEDWARLDMTGQIPQSFYRESVYVGKHDRILNLNQHGLFACALANGNRWKKLKIDLPDNVKVNPNTAMVYDPGLDVLVLFSGGNVGPVHIWLMRYEPQR